jgi:hypothetical protein
MLGPTVGRTHHHRTNVCIGTVVPPPTRMSILLALPGPDVDTDHAVVIVAAAMMITIVTLLRMYSPPLDWKQSRLRKSEQEDRWSFCLTAGTLCPTNQETR